MPYATPEDPLGPSGKGFWYTMAMLLLGASWWNKHQGVITLASLIVAVAAIAIAVVIYFRQRQTKTLDWQLLTNEQIFSSPGATPAGLVVAWQGTPLKHPRLITIRLKNTGKREVRADDFDGPVIIRTPNSQIMTANLHMVMGTMRSRPTLRFDDDFCEAAPVLYNRDDFVDIQLVVDGPTKSMSRNAMITVDIVIAGQTRSARQVDPRRHVFRNNVIAGLAGGGIAVGVSMLVTYTGH